MIENIDDFINKIVNFNKKVFIGANITEKRDLTYAELSYFPIKEDLFCSQCGNYRKSDIEHLYVSEEFNKDFINDVKRGPSKSVYSEQTKEIILERVRLIISPSFWKCQCLQCNSISYIVIYDGPMGNEFILLPSSFGGLSTPNTPENVAFYLDQANRSHIMGANSAAMAMYRAAIEHILVGHGYQRRMLGNKIQDLLKDIEESRAPQWAYEFDTDFLQFIKKLGDSAIHANDGDTEQQVHLDNELIKSVKAVISFLIYVIYESAHKRKLLLNNLKDTLQKMND